MKCDKCGKEVPFYNDAVRIETEKSGQPTQTLLYHSRHFLPTEDCEGSSSRAQYIEGQPRDKRGCYPYIKEEEAAWRAAYEKVRGNI